MLAHIGDGISTGKNAKMEVCQRGKEQVRAWKGWTKYALQQEGKRGGGTIQAEDVCLWILTRAMTSNIEHMQKTRNSAVVPCAMYPPVSVNSSQIVAHTSIIWCNLHLPAWGVSQIVTSNFRTNLTALAIVSEVTVQITCRVGIGPMS